MARTPSTTATPVIETIDSQRNGSGGTPFYTAIVRADIDGHPRRLMAQFSAPTDPETHTIGNIRKDAEGNLIAFVTDFDAAVDGNLRPSFRGDVLVEAWLPALREALAAKEAADAAQRERENEELRARTRETILDILTRTGLPTTEEYIEASRAVVFPGVRNVDDSQLADYKSAINSQVREIRKQAREAQRLNADQ